MISDEAFADLFWSDLYFDLQDFDIPFEKEYEE